MSHQFSHHALWLNQWKKGDVFVYPIPDKERWIAFFLPKTSATTTMPYRYFFITFAVLFVVGSILVLLFSSLLCNRYLSIVPQIEEALSQEISSSTRILQTIHNSWNGYLCQKRETKQKWAITAAESANLKEIFYRQFADVLEELRKIALSLGEQSHQIKKMTASLTEMSTAVKSVSSHAHTAVTTSKTSETDAKKGGDIVSQIIKHMNKITQTVSKSALVIQELRQRSDEIGDIIHVIDDIADQTDLLALNAAIEAARAGPQGRGFAVVADQVRSLAEKTSHATKEIAATLSSIQERTAIAVAAMDERIKEIDEGAGFAVQAGVSLRKIVSGAKRVTEMVTTIAEETEKQSQSALIASSLVLDLSRDVENTCENSKSILIHVQNLEQQMQKLSQFMESFLNRGTEASLEEEIVHLSERTNKEILLRNQRLEKIHISIMEPVMENSSIKKNT
jgi:methyl-accepting chemotaxis protein